MANREPGYYEGRIVSAEIFSAKTGTHQLLFHVSTEIGFAPVYLALTETTLGTPQKPGWIAVVLQFLGFNGDWNDMAQFQGIVARLQLRLRAVEDGGEREEWVFLTPRPTDPIIASDLKKKFGGLFQRRAGLPAPVRPAQPTPAAPVEDTQADIPF